MRPAAAAVPRAGLPQPPVAPPGLGALALGAAAAQGGPGAALAAALGALQPGRHLAGGFCARGIPLPQLPPAPGQPVGPMGFGLQLPAMPAPPPAAPGRCALGGASASSSAPPLPGDTWLHIPSLPLALNRLAVQPDDLLETAFMLPAGTYHGSALFKVLMIEPPDVGGQFMAVEFCGASDGPLAEWISRLLAESQLSGLNLILHLCDGTQTPCRLDYPNLTSRTVHADYIRVRSSMRLHEDWIPGCYKVVMGQPQAGSPVFPAHGRLPPPVSRYDPDAVALEQKYEKLKGDYHTGAPLAPHMRLIMAAADAAQRMRKKRKLDMDSDDDEETGLLSLFRAGSPRELDTVAAMALRSPGRLYQNGLDEIGKFLTSRGEPGNTGASYTPQKMVAYLTSIFHGAYPVREVGQRDSRELRTLAEALDALAAGSLPAVGDLLMQRFKALEQKVIDGDWGTASRLELLPERQVGLTPLSEQTSASRAQLLHLKLLEAKKRYGAPQGDKKKLFSP